LACCFAHIFQLRDMNLSIDIGHRLLRGNPEIVFFPNQLLHPFFPDPAELEKKINHENTKKRQYKFRAFRISCSRDEKYHG